MLSPRLDARFEGSRCRTRERDSDAPLHGIGRSKGSDFRTGVRFPIKPRARVADGVGGGSGGGNTSGRTHRVGMTSCPLDAWEIIEGAVTIEIVVAVAIARYASAHPLQWMTKFCRGRPAPIMHLYPEEWITTSVGGVF